MSTSSRVGKSLDEILQDKLTLLESTMRSAIINQQEYYNQCKDNTVSKVLGDSNSSYDLVQHFKYQATVKTVLTEMERTYLEYFGKPWDYVEPEAPKVEKRKRGRPKKK